MIRNVFRGIAGALNVVTLVALLGTTAYATPHTSRGWKQTAAAGEAAPARPSATTGSIRGVVIDSIRLGPLAGATVQVNNTTHAAITDSTGAFTIDSIEPGTYQLAVFHPVLDSLRFSVITNTIRVNANAVHDLAISTPSVLTLIGKSCPAPTSLDDAAAVVGQVKDAESGAPLSGVTVTMLWQMLEAGKKIGVRRVDEQRSAVTKADGSYTICGVSPEASGRVYASLDAARTGAVPIEFQGTLLEIRDLHLSLATPDTSNGARRGPHVLQGRVLAAEDGTPLQHANVAVAGTTAATTTASDGTFRLTGLPPGSQVVVARQVGRAPEELPVNLSDAQPPDLAIRLRRQSTVLATVNIEQRVAEVAIERRLKRVGFEDRKTMRVGRFLDRKQLDRMNAFNATDIFSQIPGFTIAGGKIRSIRGGNTRIWIDGIQYEGDDLDAELHATDIIGIETYRGMFIPPEYQARTRSTERGTEAGAVIVIWTKRVR